MTGRKEYTDAAREAYHTLFPQQAGHWTIHAERVSHRKLGTTRWLTATAPGEPAVTSRCHRELAWKLTDKEVV